MSMSYFPPKGFEDIFGYIRNTHKGPWKLGNYKSWWMSISLNDKQTFDASVWTHYPLSNMAYDNKTISFNKKGFKTEEDAAQWCKTKVDSRFKFKIIKQYYCIDAPNDQTFQYEVLV